MSACKSKRIRLWTCTWNIFFLCNCCCFFSILGIVHFYWLHFWLKRTQKVCSDFKETCTPVLHNHCKPSWYWSKLWSLFHHMLDFESCNFDVLLLLKIRFLSTCLQRHHNHKDHLQQLTTGRESDLEQESRCFTPRPRYRVCFDNWKYYFTMYMKTTTETNRHLLSFKKIWWTNILPKAYEI